MILGYTWNFFIANEMLFSESEIQKHKHKKNKKMSNTNPTLTNRGCSLMLAKNKQFMFLIRRPPCNQQSSDNCELSCPVNIDYNMAISISVPVSSRNFHISPRRQPRADMGRGMIPGPMWKRLCYNLLITYLTMTEINKL